MRGVLADELAIGQRPLFRLVAGESPADKQQAAFVKNAPAVVKLWLRRGR
ncbi:hypothetical protein [Paludibacterium denitrificans]|nr:hypothetical protein [Paludibacterium denitrificans]